MRNNQALIARSQALHNCVDPTITWTVGLVVGTLRLLYDGFRQGAEDRKVPNTSPRCSRAGYQQEDG